MTRFWQLFSPGSDSSETNVLPSHGTKQQPQPANEDLSEWLIQKTEEIREDTLREFVALMVHDVANPLHSIRFCLDQFFEEPHLLQNPKYREVISGSLSRALELIESLRSHVNGAEGREGFAYFHSCYEQAQRLFESRFIEDSFRSIRFDVEPRVKALKVRIPKIELIHLLQSVLALSTEGFLANPIPDPCVEISLKHFSSEEAVVAISEGELDLRSGPLCEEWAFKRIQRFAQRYGAELTLLGPTQESRRATFLLKLPVVEEPQG